MLWFKRRNVEMEKLEELNQVLVNSFDNVRKDTQNLYAWMQYLYEQNQRQAQTIQDLQLQLKFMPKTPEQIKYIVDRYYDYEGLLQRLKELKARIEEIKSLPAPAPVIQQVPVPAQQAPQPAQHATQNSVLTKMENIALRLERLEEKQQGQKAYIREKIIKKIAKNSKEYIRDRMYSLIRKYEKISALTLREMIVEEQGLCSKSSFYRILEELESQDDIETVHDKKEKYYFFKALRHT